MKDDEALLLLAAVLMLGGKRVDVTWGDGWLWPLPPIRVGGSVYLPTVSDGFGSPRGSRTHAGMDVAYPRKARGDVPQFRPGTRDGTPMFFLPPKIPVLASRPGKVWRVRKGVRGWEVTLDHSRPWATFYTHLEVSALPLHDKGVNTATGQETRVNAGDIIGFAGHNPEDPEGFRHLHFEVWHGGAGEHAVDAESAMRTWPTVSWVVNA